MTLNRIAVLGLGKVGRLAAELLNDAGLTVVGFDQRAQNIPGVQTRVRDLANPSELEGDFGEVDAILSCLPYHLNIAIAEIAHKMGLHYFDLTEDVPTTQRIIELSSSGRTLMAPQCGLAPGFVGIVATHLEQQLESCRSLRLRVGALPQHPTGLLGYAFNWSPEGVVNEYLNDCEVIEEGIHKWVSPMEWHETLYVTGTKLEAFTTSGGLGTMCQTYLGQVANIDYKTLRYPGHVDLMNFFFHELLMRERRDLAGEILTNAKPPVSEDVVFVHVAAEGSRAGQALRDEYVRSFYPRSLFGQPRTAIAWTTAASVTAVIELVRQGELPQTGFLSQESIAFDKFTETRAGALFVNLADDS